MPQRMICMAWRKNKVRQDECMELAKIIRGLDQTVLGVDLAALAGRELGGADQRSAVDPKWSFKRTAD